MVGTDEIEAAKDRALEVFHKRLYRAMRNANKRRGEIMRETGIAYNTLRVYLNGHRTPNAANLVGLAKCLGVSTDYLLGLED